MVLMCAISKFRVGHRDPVEYVSHQLNEPLSSPIDPLGAFCLVKAPGGGSEEVETSEQAPGCYLQYESMLMPAELPVCQFKYECVPNQLMCNVVAAIDYLPRHIIARSIHGFANQVRRKMLGTVPTVFKRVPGACEDLGDRCVASRLKVRAGYSIIARKFLADPEFCGLCDFDSLVPQRFSESAERDRCLIHLSPGFQATRSGAADPCATARLQFVLARLLSAERWGAAP
jgi:hypothetical protein